MEDDTFGKIVILTFEDTEEQIMNRILSYIIGNLVSMDSI